MQIKKDDIRSNILITAERLFLKRGYNETSLKMISERCNISKSNIYRYFSSKEEIYDTIITPARVDIMDSAPFFYSQEYMSKDIEEKCSELSAVLARLFYDHHSRILIMLREAGRPDRKLLEDLIIRNFIDTCPLEDESIKRLISSVLIFGLTDILLDNTDEQSIEKKLKALIYYHYLGLNGIKERSPKR